MLDSWHITYPLFQVVINDSTYSKKLKKQENREISESGDQEIGLQSCESLVDHQKFLETWLRP